MVRVEGRGKQYFGLVLQPGVHRSLGPCPQHGPIRKEFGDNPYWLYYLLLHAVCSYMKNHE